MGRIAVASLSLGLIAAATVLALRAAALSRLAPGGLYIAALAEKDALASRFPAPRVFLVAGSNAAFGVDSVALSSALGRPVVNLGLHIALGLDFMLNQAGAMAERSDTVVIMPEYSSFLGAHAGAPETLADAFLARPSCIRYMRSPAQLRLLASGLVMGEPRWLAGTFLEAARRLLPAARPAAGPAGYLYVRNGFNAHGDEVRHLGFPAPPGREKLRDDPGDAWDPAGAALVNSFAARVARRGVRVAFVFPSYARQAYEDHRALLDRVALDLRKNLDVPVLDKLEDGLVPASHLFDTAHHLNARGIAARTRHLESILAPFLRTDGARHGRGARDQNRP